jgi:hypothetical protein
VAAAFEDKVKEREANNPRFAFLKPDDIFHKYYRSLVDPPKPKPPPPVPPPTEAPAAEGVVPAKEGGSVDKPSGAEEPGAFCVGVGSGGPRVVSDVQGWWCGGEQGPRRRRRGGEGCLLVVVLWRERGRM